MEVGQATDDLKAKGDEVLEGWGAETFVEFL
jgi:hypothetical protein